MNNPFLTAMIAMSGGVDSAVAALLIKQAGFSVTGVTMKLFCDGEAIPTADGTTDDMTPDIRDARAVADRLGIPHLVCRLEKTFCERVVDEFVRTYLDGGTPNPCVICNKTIKFGALLDFAKANGLDTIATGHYARIAKEGDRYLICRAIDEKKDQSYMLWSLSQDVLAHVKFPLGELTKTEVREIAAAHGFESVMPSYQIFKALCKVDKTLQIDKSHMMIVSPDEGALDRNIFYASVLGLDMGMFYKRRDYTRIVNGRNPIVAHEYLGSSMEGKDVFVADDIIASGDSILDLARELKKRKANRIFASATFALFTNGLDAFHKAYEEGLIDKVISTNLTYRTPELQAAPWFVEADMSKYISYIVATLNHDRSISKLLRPHDRIKSLLARYNAEQAEAGIRLV